MALGELTRAHLVEITPGPPDRWRMHNLLRLYARRLSDAYTEADRLERARDLVKDRIELIAALQSLPSRQSEVIGLHYFGGYTIAETAEILAIKEETARKHLNRGLEELRQRQGP